MKDILQKLAAIETSTTLTESAVAEAGNFDSKKISTGTVYTRKYDPETGETVGTQRTAEPEKKKGRGRPKKDAGNDGEVMKPDWSAFGVKPVKLSKDPNARKIKGRDTVDESVMRRAMDVIESALVLEKEMTDAQMAKREEIVKAMKADGGLEGFKKRYGSRAEAVMYATATKQAMKEAFVAEGKPDFLDLDKDGDKEEDMKDAAKDAEEKEEVKESVELAECGEPMMPAGEVTISGTPDALATMLKMAGMAAPAPMAAPAMEEEAEEEVEEEYANEPDEEVQDLEAAIPSGDDLHREKGAYPATAGGDNPMAIDEEMWAAYQALKSELQ